MVNCICRTASATLILLNIINALVIPGHSSKWGAPKTEEEVIWQTVSLDVVVNQLNVAVPYLMSSSPGTAARYPSPPSVPWRPDPAPGTQRDREIDRRRRARRLSGWRWSKVNMESLSNKLLLHWIVGNNKSSTRQPSRAIPDAWHRSSSRSRTKLSSNTTGWCLGCSGKLKLTTVAPHS